jgi:hypothetical protein
MAMANLFVGTPTPTHGIDAKQNPLFQNQKIKK